MAQDLLKMSTESLQLQLPSLSFGILKDLYVRLYQHMRNFGDVIEPNELIKIQRKITKIQFELNARSKLIKNKDFVNWEKSLMHKLKRG